MSSSLGGAGRAGVNSSEGVFLNPALVALLSRSEMIGYYQDGAISKGRHAQAWGVTLSQSSDDVYFPGALSYLRLRDTRPGLAAQDGELWHVAIGKLFFKRLAVGASAYRLDESVAGEKDWEQWNGALGGVFLITNHWGVAYVYENPFSTSSDIPEALRLFGKQSLGTYYMTPYHAALVLDLQRWEQFNPKKQWDVHAGIEVESNPFVIVRLGAEWLQAAHRTDLTAGFTFNGPRIKVDYAFIKNVRGIGGALHSVDLRATF